MPTSLRDARYLLAYSVPLAALGGIWLGGIWSWLTPVYVFGLIPALEGVFTTSPAAQAAESVTGLRRGFFNGLLYLNVGTQYALLLIFLHTLSQEPRALWEQAGMVFSMGVCCGTLGINVAHELGHRASRAERTMAHLLLLSTFYLHFYIEHNRGHHRHVATPLDPATARFNEPFFQFLPRAVSGEYQGAWRLEHGRLQQQQRSWWSAGNQMLRFQLYQAGLLVVVGAVFGWVGLLGWLGACAVGIILFQLVNYVEHYGLQRRHTATGSYERVQPWHSWNSEHPFGRILLYELTRHSDHHYQASRPYHALRRQPQSPQMPTGYPGMMLLATVPPLWFRVMNKRVPTVMEEKSQLPPKAA
ncbi:alkane 1-monooxygenase [Hymenobacter fastidiosus]|uniref:Alkane 1-monooxygenase n=1 Tax=Hymenobacter fastidiosus TaxID=486264 RepID=A0ABP7STB7_9BACT